MYRIHKTEQAEHDLVNIWSYTYKNWGDKQADNYLDGLADAISVIADNPLMYRLREEFIRPVRMRPHAHHLIIYEVLPEAITIVRVLHESMDIEIQLDADSL